MNRHYLKSCRFWNGLLAALCVIPHGLFAKEPDSPAVDFGRDIYPVLQRACFECHGPIKQEGGLRLDLRSEALESGSIVAGDPAESELLRRIALPKGHDEIMPAIGEPLTQQQITLLERWVAQGAVWPDAFEQPPHWSYVAPRRPELPEVDDEAWVRSPIDRFVLERLGAEGLSHAPLATPEKRVRRLFLDLIGLPPTPAEVQAFVAQPTAQRWEELVDDLLERPQVGERWARPWLDLARYADSHGFQRDDLRDNWAYRDWVIAALNQDMPFDQFTIEQLAGDLLPEASESQKIATGFHRCAPTNVEAGSLPEETRTEQVLDRVNTTGAIWLGSTLECCQCHDHKYDPFTIKEYYQLFAFYNNTALEADRTNPKTPSSIRFQGPSMALSNAERDAQRTALEVQLAELEQQQTERQQALESQVEAWAGELLVLAKTSPQTHPVTVEQFTSQGPTDSYELTEDGSILLTGGDPPDKDTYRVRGKAVGQQVVGFRLDVLRHDSLPGGGPGRGAANRQNFVLNDFVVELSSTGTAAKPPRQLKFARATASFSQKQWEVEGAIDGDPKSGWGISPKFDQSHWAVFELEEAVDLSEEHELTFTLAQNLGRARTIGCLRLSAITGNLEQKPIEAQLLEIAERPADSWSKEERQKLLEAFAAQDRESNQRNKRITALQRQIADLAPDTTLVMVELPQPRKSTVFVGGDYRSPGEIVEPDTPAALHPLSDDLAEGPRNRLTLARWLVSADNPLVARATVNRWWAELFGQGIVTTPEDLGIKGEPPSHPELLDWLAVEFMESGWSMKHVLKEIVLSATYQQSSDLTPELLARDDKNRWLARGPRLRMDAEMIRDNALAIAGLLNLKQSGPPIRPPQPDGIWKKVGGQAYDYKVSPGSEQFRRGVYVVLKRGAPYPSFVNFDATSRMACTVSRSRTNTPLQALTLLNDPVYVTAAQGLAERVLVERSSATLDQQLAYAFQLCVARGPTDRERQTLRHLFETQVADERQQHQPGDRHQVELRAWTSVAAALLNLHETITKD